MSPMSPRLLRPRSTFHPEALAWRSAVIANGASVSGSTLTAVSQLCRDINAVAGLRQTIYRMGIFAGTGLNACLVPLYRGPTLGGTQYGNTTDTNVGPFITDDYVETGSSGGLTGNGSTKYLNTGFPTNTVLAGNRHISAYAATWPNSVYQYFMGSEANDPATNKQMFLLGHDNDPLRVRFNFGATTGGVQTGQNVSAGAFWLGVEDSAGNGVLYKNGASAASGSTTSATPDASAIFVFAFNRAGYSVAVTHFNGRMCGYSIGAAMTASQAAAYNTAVQAFQTALGRNV